MKNQNTISKYAGFEQPRSAQDAYTAALWTKYGLSEQPSLQEIEPVVLPLLGNITTFFEGAAMVLGRRVDARETGLVAMYLLGAEQAFAALLLQLATEDEAAKKASMDTNVSEN